MRRINDAQRRDVRDRYSRGLSLRSIARETGFSLTSVRRITADMRRGRAVGGLGLSLSA
ncbi:hypothetical protein PAPHI01_2771 [Pancytospora philotis]|nr:hypothetical protein PAPHI01_2771 [Pancytospora philotis]